jgi:GDPmannose 4,6-dehydratase
MSDKKVALVTGATGQDGSFLVELLVQKGYDVHCMVRRQSMTENQQTRIEHLGNAVHRFYGDLLDVSSIEDALRRAKPTEVYNLAAQSHVRVSYDIPQYTVQANALGVLNIVEAVRRYAPEARFYQASSSEMFGNAVDADRMQRETTAMKPVSPYGCAKLFGYNIVRNYRQAYKMFATNGILFNHESPRRGSNFVTSKIIKNAVNIYRCRQKTLELGNLDSSRDWGHAKDYVRAMWMMLQHDTPDDFVVATGETHTIREFLEIVFRKLGMDYREYVVQNPQFMRPEELDYLCGDSSKVRNVLGWKPEYSFEALVEDMLNTELKEKISPTEWRGR